MKPRCLRYPFCLCRHNMWKKSERQGCAKLQRELGHSTSELLVYFNEALQKEAPWRIQRKLRFFFRKFVQLLFLCVSLLHKRSVLMILSHLASQEHGAVLVFTLHHVSCLAKSALDQQKITKLRHFSDNLSAGHKPKLRIYFEPSLPRLGDRKIKNSLTLWSKIITMKVQEALFSNVLKPCANLGTLSSMPAHPHCGRLQNKGTHWNEWANAQAAPPFLHLADAWPTNQTPTREPSKF